MRVANVPVTLLLVALGGAAGSVLRYVLGIALVTRLGAALPYGTLLANTTGSFAIGLAAALLARKGASPALWAFLVPGLLGGYTTFSALEYETLALLRAGEMARALLYVGGSVVVGLLGCWLGARVAGGSLAG